MSKQKRETYDVVQWDGLKETALAFFGMSVIEDKPSGWGWKYEEISGELWWYDDQDDDSSFHVNIGEWITRGKDLHISVKTEEEFNNEYEIIDEYPA